MMERLVIRNFQLHDKLILDLSPTVSCFIGPSDKGKSAILRLLRWVCLNRPQGEAFVREGTEHCYGRLHVDGHEVLRERGPGLNAYGLDGHRFQAFGLDVPPEIASLLNVSELNWQRQHDAPFWLSLSPGQVSRELNAVVDLEVIDASLAAAASEVRHARSEAEVSEKRLAQAKEERNQLAWVREASDSLSFLSSLESEIEENLLKRSRIGDLLREGERAASEGDRLSGAVLDGLLGVRKGEEALAREEEAGSLKETLNELSTAEGERCRLDEYLADVHKELEELMRGMKTCPLCNNPLGIENHIEV